MGLGYIIGVLAALMATIIMTTLAIMNMVSFGIYMTVMTTIGIVTSITLLMLGLLVGNVMFPFLSAKMAGHTMLANITAGKSIELLHGREKEGMIKTNRGYFIVVPEAVLNWPCGVRAGITYFKYGVMLPKKMINAAVALRKAGINDIRDLEKVAERSRIENQDVVLKV